MKKQLIIMTAAAMTAALLPAMTAGAAEYKCEMSAEVTDTGYTVTVNNSGAETEARLYAAVYDKDGAFVSMQSQPVTIKSGSNSYTADAKPAADQTVQLFLWDMDQNPIADSAYPAADTRLDALSVADIVKNDSGGYYRVSFNEDDDTAKAYLNAITSVTVGGVSYSSYSSDGYDFSGSKYRIGTEGYWYSSGGVKEKYLDLTDGSIPDYEVKTDIVVKAEGYKDLTLSIDNSDKHLAAAPAVSGAELNYDSPDYYRVSFTDESAADEYLRAVTAVTVGDKTYSMSSYWYSSTKASYKRVSEYGAYGSVYKYLDLTADGVAESGKTTVTVAAKGYVDQTFTIDNSNVTLKTPPAVRSTDKVEATSSYSAGYYTVSFDGTDTASYLDRISSVTVGSTAYSKTSWSFYSSDRSRYRIYNGAVQLTTNGVAETGTTTVTVTAKGYEDLTFTIDNSSTVGGDEPVEPQGDKEVKSFVPQNVVLDTSYNGAYQLEYSASDAIAWVQKITSVKVNGGAYSNGSYVVYSSDLYYKGSYSLMLSKKSGFVTGDNTIVIEADGYKTMTMVITVDSNDQATVKSVE